MIYIDMHSTNNNKKTGFEIFANQLKLLIDNSKDKKITGVSFFSGKISRVLNCLLLLYPGKKVYITNPPLIWCKSLLQNVYFVCHDIGMIIDSSTSQKITAIIYKKFIEDMLSCGKVLAVSEFTAREIERIYRVKVKVIGNFHQNFEGIKESKSIPILEKNFILTVGTVEPRKNYLLLFNGLLSLHNKGINVQCVLVGRIGWDKIESINLLNKLIEQKIIIHYENIDKETLVYLYKNCIFYISTSVYEGYNMPVFEALSFKKYSLVAENTAPTYENVPILTFKNNDQTDFNATLLATMNKIPLTIRSNYKINSEIDVFSKMINCIAI